MVAGLVDGLGTSVYLRSAKSALVLGSEVSVYLVPVLVAGFKQDFSDLRAVI